MARNLQLARLFYDIEANTKGLDRELGNAERSFGRTAAFIAKNPVVALGALGAAFAATALKATEMASKFENSMAEVSTLVDTTSVDMKKLSQGVLELYRNLPVENIEQLTQGLYNVISAGVPAADAIGYLEIATRAAVGGVTDVNTAVNGLTTATNAFASQGITATSAADKFFTAVRLGKTTFAEISGSIGNVAGLANSLGVSLDDLLSNMTALTLGGINTSQAFNALRQILANVAKPTSELLRSYPQLAKEFDLSALKTKGLTQFMTELAGKLKGNDDAAVKMFGSVEALNAVLSLTADGGARLNAIQDQMASSAGAADAAFNKMAQSNRNLNQVLKNELSVQMLQLGEKLLPLVNAELKGLIGLIGLLNGSVAQIRVDAAANTINTISKAMDRLSPETRAKEVIRLRDALGQVVGADPRNFAEAWTNVTTTISRGVDQLATQDLQRLYQGLSAAANSGELTADQMTKVGGALQLVAKQLSSRGDAIIPAAATAGLTAAGDAASGATTAITALGPASDEAAKKAKEAADAYAAAMKKIQETLIASTVSLVDDTEQAIRTMRDELVKAGVKAEDVARALRPLNEQLALIKVNEKFDLPEILKKSANAFTDRDVHRLIEAQTELDALHKTAAAGSKEALAIDQQRDAVQGALLGRVTATTAQVTAAVKPSKELVDRAREYGYELDAQGRLVPIVVDGVKTMAAQVREVALGAIGVAEGFGLIDSKAASALKSVVGIADSLPKAFSGDPSAIFSVLGGLTGVIGSLFGGNSAEERARKELLRKNTEALTDLVRVNGNLLRVNSPGFKLSGVREALTAVDLTAVANITGGPGIKQRRQQDAVRDALIQAGLTLADLDAVAKDLGIEIRDKSGTLNIAALQQLLDALKTGQFTRFADEIQEQFERIKGAIEVGLIDPADELTEIVKVLSRPELGKNVPAIADALAGLDLKSDPGKAEGIKRIQALFDALGKGTLSESAFGGLNGKDFRDLLIKLFGLLGGKPIEGVTGGGADTTTEAGGGLGAAGGADTLPLGALALPVVTGLDDLLGVGEETNTILDQILGTLGRDPGPLAPIELPKGWQTRSAPGAGSTISVSGFTINVYVAGSQASPEQIGQATQDAIRAGLDQYLGAELLRQRTIRGDGGLP